LLDIGMPRSNGFGAYRRIREEPWGQHMTLIAVSGWEKDEDRH
jgi:CheY-like chemotaxis protein